MCRSIAFALPTTALTVRFDGPQLTSDGGLYVFANADRALGVCAGQALERRQGPVWYRLETLVRRRVFQIACGYDYSSSGVRQFPRSSSAGARWRGG